MSVIIKKNQFATAGADLGDYGLLFYGENDSIIANAHRVIDSTGIFDDFVDYGTSFTMGVTADLASGSHFGDLTRLLTRETGGTITVNASDIGSAGNESFSTPLASDGLSVAAVSAHAELPVAAPQPAAAAFAAGNIVVYRVGAVGGGALGSAATAVFLDEYNSSGTLVQSIAMPTADSGANQMLTATGNATSEGLLSRSADGRYLIFTGYDAAVGTAGLAGTTSATVQRVVGRVDADGVVDTSTTLGTAFSTGNIRGAVSLDGSSFWASGSTTGVVNAAYGATTSTVISNTVTNLRGIDIADGQLYVSSMSGALRIGTVGTGTPTTGGQTITNLTGFPTTGSTNSPYQFFFADLSAAVAGVDTLYVSDDRSTGSGGGLLKYSLVSGSWVLNGTAAGGLTTGLRGLDGNVSGTTVQFYATTTQASANSIVTLTDTGGYNAAFSTTSFTTVATAAANTVFRGVAFAPTGAVTPQPGSLSINDITLSEGNSGTTNFTFTVTRSGGSSGAVSATWTLADGTTDAADFTGALTGTVNFADGETSQTITVTVAGDTAVETNETFFINLSAPTGGATITDGQGQGTITNDDTPPVGTLSINDVSIAEGNSGTSNIVFTVTRSGGSAGAVDATWTLTNGTTDASDFGTSTFTGTVSFADGQTSATISIPVAGDTTVEASETFTVTLSNPTNGATITDGSGIGTITNDDIPPIANVWINEFHYDDASTDSGEGVEVAGLAGTDLSGWSLVFYNGTNGTVYRTTALSGTVANQSNGYGTVSFALPVDGIQNGSPDGIALVDNVGRVLQFLSYEGTMVAVGGPANGMTSVDIGVSEEGVPEGYSLQLIGAGGSYADFSWTVAAISNTFGSPNTGQSFLSPTDPGQIRVLDASVAEGNSGESMLTFTVRRAGGTALTSDVGYTINLDGTANAADLGPSAVLSGTVHFAVGETERTITVAIQGDTVGEFNETLSVALTTVTNASIVDGNATGTIINDDPLSLAIYQIQGKTHTSAYAGQNVTTTGIVTAVDTDGFYVQDPTGDGRVATSDAIFVFTSTAPGVAVGDSVSITGTVAEVRPGNNLANLTITQITTPAVTVVSSGHALPAAVLIGTGGLLPPTDVFDDDQFTSNDFFGEASDFYEALEGMRVTIDAPLVTSATNSFGETFVVASGGVGATGVNSRGGITISGNANNFDDYNPERIQIDDDSGLFAGFSPNYTQGDRLSNVTGIMSYNFQYYELLVTEAVTVTTDVGALTRETTALDGTDNRLSIAAYNVENLDPGDNKFDILAADIVYNLGAPDIISLEEIQDGDGAGNGTDLSGYVTAQGLINAITAIGGATGPHYVYIEVTPTVAGSTGGEPGGNIRNGFLYNIDRVAYVAGSAVAVPGSAFNGSRSPLSAQFSFNGETITAISVHSTSRGGSDPLFGSTQPPANAGEAARIAQSTAIRAYVTNLLSNDPNAYVAVMGDFNAFYFEDSLELLENGVLTNLHRLLPEAERYSYMFEGNAQAIDHILVSNNLLSTAQFDAVHLNSEQPDTPSRPTDHDPVIATLLLNSSAVAQASSASGDEDTTITGSVTATDRNGDDLSYVLVDGPAHGSVVLNANGTYTYTPDANFNGNDSFTFTANDGVTNGTVAAVSLTVNPVNDAPNDVTLSANSVAENSANGTVVGTATASDPDSGSVFTYKLVDDAGGRFAIDTNTGVITVANGSLLDYETATSHTITIRVFDGILGSSYKEIFTIQVTDVAEAPAAMDISALLGGDVVPDVSRNIFLKSEGDGSLQPLNSSNSNQELVSAIQADRQIDGVHAFAWAGPGAFSADGWGRQISGGMLRGLINFDEIFAAREVFATNTPPLEHVDFVL